MKKILLVAATVFVSSMAIGQSVETTNASPDAPSLAPVSPSSGAKSACCASMAGKSCSKAEKKACADKSSATSERADKNATRSKASSSTDAPK
ncbi:MAG: hypothetical protein RLP15_13230 [Cryomorphaceae bacterium]